MSRPLNVLLTNSTDIYGGGEFFVYELAKALHERKHNVHVVCRPDNLLREKCEQAKISVFPLDFLSKGQLIKIISRLRSMIQENNIQLVHTNSNYDRTAGAFAAWPAGVSHVTNVHSLHSIQHNFTHFVRNRMLTDHFLADGVQARDMLIKEDGIPQSKISLFYHGINPDETRRDEQLRNKIRTQFGFSDEHIVIGNIGRLVPMKGQEYLINAFAEVVKKNSCVRLVLVGDGVLKDELMSQAQKLGIQQHVVFAGFREDLQALYSSFDMFILASLAGGGETISFATQQALAAELPVIVTNVGDVVENVREGVNGFIVPDRNAPALAEKIFVLVQDRSLREKMGKESHKYLLDRFTTEHMVSAVEEIYRKVLQNRKNSQ